tara:strand:+ start:635 stop:1156 length:522 start_codon:yes stop_codon:yes gene_type:complete
MKYLKLTALMLLLTGFFNWSHAEELYFVNMQQVLNKSKAGSTAQESLKKEFASQDKKFKAESASLKKEETELISQKKSLSPEEYKKKVSALRKKNIDFQTRRRNASNDFIRKKTDARNKLIQAINPILEKYMSENNVMMIINEKNVVLANSKRDLTKTIIDLLNKELKSIKLN